MANSNDKRRVEDLTVDKTMRVTTTLGFIVTLVIGVWFVGRWTDQVEDSTRDIAAEIQELWVSLDDVADRQQKYIERNTAVHEDDKDDDAGLAAAIAIIREAWAAQFGEALP